MKRIKIQRSVNPEFGRCWEVSLPHRTMPNVRYFEDYRTLPQAILGVIRLARPLRTRMGRTGPLN